MLQRTTIKKKDIESEVSSVKEHFFFMVQRSNVRKSLGVIGNGKKRKIRGRN